MKKFYAAYSIAFVLILLIPLIFIDPKGGKVSEEENRMLALRPPVSDILVDAKEYVSAFDHWFTDNIGFRNLFIDSYKNLAWNTKNVQYMEGPNMMLLGEEGHRFFAYTNGWMIKKFQGKQFLSEEQLQWLAGGTNKAMQYLEERGIPLVVMLCTDKEEIYPEYYPKSIIQGSGPTQLELVTAYMETHTDAMVFNIKERLLEAKKNYPVFDKVGDLTSTLSHYNEIGAFFAYQELMEHLKVYMPETEPLTATDVNITYEDQGIYEDVPDVQLKQPASYTRLDQSFFDAVPLDHPSRGIAFENVDSTLPTILIMRDSYVGEGNYMSRYIPEHFGKTISIHYNNMANLAVYVDYFKPDIVLFESAEREFAGFAGCVSTLLNLPD